MRYTLPIVGATFIVTLGLLVSAYILRGEEQVITVETTSHFEAKIAKDWLEMVDFAESLEFPDTWGIGELVAIRPGPSKIYYAYFEWTVPACKLEVPIKFGYRGNSRTYKAFIGLSDLQCLPSRRFTSTISDSSYNNTYKNAPVVLDALTRAP